MRALRPRSPRVRASAPDEWTARCVANYRARGSIRLAAPRRRARLGRRLFANTPPSAVAAIFTPKAVDADATVSSERELAAYGASGGLNGKAFARQPSRNFREVSIGGTEAIGELIGA